MALIEVHSLTYTYPGADRPTLVDISFEVSEGEFIVLTGPSGCGKSTLCRCLNGLIPHSYGGEFKGKVIVDGLNTLEHPVYVLAQKVGLVFQTPENQLFCSTVEKEIAFGLENLGLPRDEILKRIDEALELMDIKHIRYSSPEELSGGEQQKVAIAACLAMKPKVLVLDEPTAHLDPLSAFRLLKTLEKLNQELNIAILLVEHRLDMVVESADRVMVMHEGKIIVDAPPQQAFT
ncbi:MAG: ABC transporter ATP-binding protein, partial [Candidatus Methanomethylicota archaeon]